MSLPSVKVVRSRIENVQQADIKYALQCSFLFAGRISEVVGRSSLKDTSVARGVKGTSATIENFLNEEAVVFQVHTAKRSGKLRPVAVPCSYEAWAKPLFLYFQEHGDEIVFPFTRQFIGLYVKEHGIFQGLTYPIERYKVKRKGELEKIIVPAHKRNFALHALRHLRATELVEHYGFDGFELATYGGWTYQTMARVTSSMERYLALRWQSYFPKLLRN